MRLLTLALVFVAPSITLAQESTPEVPAPGFQYAERTVVEFDKALELEGELVKPTGQTVLERRTANFGQMIRLRADFDAELADSTRQIQ
ncbi:MAG: hypothetical protein IPO67_08120 [Deltaproteobacteria bacterium]|nr:hypothetical protein [Deltaproteobacteria bacterium]MBK9645100.1 hypothetical protein [Deltaproteobacteria bacterium]